MRVRTLGQLAVVITAAALLPLASTAPARANDTAPANRTTSSSAVPTTTIVVKAPRCSNCRVVAVSSPRLEGRQAFYSGDVVSGRTVIRVPLHRTRGLMFTVVNPRAKGPIHGVPLVALQYKGMRAGVEVTPSRALKGRRAKVCWAGTTQKSVTLKLRTRRDSRLNSSGGYRYWLGETVATAGPWKYASRGGVAIRDGYDVCG